MDDETQNAKTFRLVSVEEMMYLASDSDLAPGELEQRLLFTLVAREEELRQVKALATRVADGLVAEIDTSFNHGLEAAAQLLEENAKDWRKAHDRGHTQPYIAHQLEAEARHVRELKRKTMTPR